MGASRWKTIVPFTNSIKETFEHARTAEKSQLTEDFDEESGFHSILDLETIQVDVELPKEINAEQELLIALGMSEGPPMLGSCYRIPDDLLERAAGTLTPRQEEVERNEEEIFAALKRGLGCYIPLYKDQSIEAVAFMGISGE